MTEPRFFVDRSLGGKIIARLLRADGWEIVTMREFYGRAGDKIRDIPWITEQAGLGYAILSCDGMILSNPLERAAVEETGARVFVLPTSRMTGAHQAERLIRHRAAIHNRATAEGPAGFVVYERQLSRVLP